MVKGFSFGGWEWIGRGLDVIGGGLYFVVVCEWCGGGVGGDCEGWGFVL